MKLEGEKNKMGNKRIVVLFPGANYSTDFPLLFYAGFKFEVRGYKKVAISYEDLLKQDKSLQECIADVKNLALIQLQNFDLSEYDDIVFVSKSLGRYG